MASKPNSGDDLISFLFEFEEANRLYSLKGTIWSIATAHQIIAINNDDRGHD